MFRKKGCSCSLVFRKSIERHERVILGKPILSMIIGNTIFLCFHLIVVINFLSSDTFKWLESTPGLSAAGALPFLTGAVLLILIFYFRFYFYLNSYAPSDGFMVE